jgi:hypothetical protein
VLQRNNTVRPTSWGNAIPYKILQQHPKLNRSPPGSLVHTGCRRGTSHGSALHWVKISDQGLSITVRQRMLALIKAHVPQGRAPVGHGRQGNHGHHCPHTIMHTGPRGGT